MTVTVKARMIGSTKQAEYDLPEGSTAQELLDRFFAEQGNAGPKENYLLMRSGKQISGAQPLQEGDCLELIMLLCGG